MKPRKKLVFKSDETTSKKQVLSVAKFAMQCSIACAAVAMSRMSEAERQAFLISAVDLLKKPPFKICFFLSTPDFLPQIVAFGRFTHSLIHKNCGQQKTLRRGLLVFTDI